MRNSIENKIGGKDSGVANSAEWGMLFEILAANPDELSKDTLISYLENKENPLPDYMIAILLQVAQGTSYKTVLQNQMSLYNQYKTKSANDIVRSILNNSLTYLTELRNWLDNTSTLRADEQIIATYMHEGNYSDTLCHTNDSTSLYTLAPATGAWGYNWQLLPEKAGTLAQDSLTATITWNTGYQGEVLISAASYNDCGESAFSEVKTTFVYTCVGVEENTAGGFGLRVYPNPAREWVTFETSGNKPTTIFVYHHTGQLVEKLELKATPTRWNTSGLPGGLYYYRAEQDGKMVTGKVVLLGE